MDWRCGAAGATMGATETAWPRPAAVFRGSTGATAPHSWQNFAETPSPIPHAAQGRGNKEALTPHSLQNFANAVIYIPQ